ncbi:MAG: hypothetical protein AAGD96_36615, partial [Chloroflexota bacterium]
MKFAKRVYLIAGVWGLLILPPMLFLEEQIGLDNPPAITHPEYFYGFLSVAIAWQVLFLFIARDPARYRPMMIPAMLEKFPIVFIWGGLWLQGRIPGVTAAFGTIDLVLGILFL